MSSEEERPRPGNATLTFSVRPGLKVWYEEYAERTGRAVSGVLEAALEEYTQTHPIHRARRSEERRP